jgi:microsomal dipeptidase-like Zn-dependent dipeptidase
LVGLLPTLVDRGLNRVLEPGPYPVGAAAQRLHDTLFVADLHADPLLWKRDLLAKASHGHVDLPRLREGGVALQVFDAVTKVPAGQNYDGNDDRSDMILPLAVAGLWPPRTWSSLTERALYQAQKLHRAAMHSNGTFFVIRDRVQLEAFAGRRRKDREAVAGVLGVEGLHALDGDLGNLDRLFDAGFRVMGLAHFFDNDLGGSAHGMSKGGITDLGRRAVEQMEKRGMLIDLAHASPRLLDDVLAIATRPLIVSHGGVKGTCDHIRNLGDEHLRRVAATGGVVGIGYWDAAVCDVSVNGIVRAIEHAVKVAGADHVALGSDFDGATTTPFDTTGIARITEGLMNAGMSHEDIAKVMGANVLRVLLATLPAG